MDAADYMARKKLFCKLEGLFSFLREYMDRVVKTDHCTQYVDDIGIATNDADHLIENLRATFECIREAGLKITMHKVHFGAIENDFLGKTITPGGVKPQKEKSTNFLENNYFKVQEGITAMSWFPQLLQELYTKNFRENW